MLKLSPRFADHEGHFLRPLDQPEMTAQYFLQSIQCTEAFPISLESSYPCLPLGMLLEPGIRRSNQEDPARVYAGMDCCQQLPRIVETVYEIGRQDEVIAGEQRLEITGIPLIKRNLLPDVFKAKPGQRALTVKDELAFVGQCIAQQALLRELNPLADETGGKIDARYVIEMPSKLKGGPSRSTAKVERVAGRFVTHRRDSQLSQCLGKIRHPEIGVAVMKFPVFREQFVSFVMGAGLYGRSFCNDIAKACMLKKMTAESIAG